MNQRLAQTDTKQVWNRGKLVGQKAPLKLKEIWAIRIRLQLAGDIRKLALFDLTIDSKLRAVTWSASMWGQPTYWSMTIGRGSRVHRS
jgi:hypothetical protein